MPEAESEELDTGKIHILQLHQCGVGRIKIQTTFSKNTFPLNSEIYVYYMRNLIRMFLTHLHLTHQSVSSEELFDVQEHFRDFFLFNKALFLEIKKVLNLYTRRINELEPQKCSTLFQAGSIFRRNNFRNELFLLNFLRCAGRGGGASKWMLGFSCQNDFLFSCW